ncbi:MAG TPA: DHA2 family efflux MFS transporter permease subunit [Acidimicrobiia bacterium]|nr:DHA2 family efflux MFS transporter permease subunit [Acidimicrobiia bacterium]
MRRAPFDLDYKWVVAAIFVCGLFMDIMDTTIVFVATPALKVHFGATDASIEWVVLGYLLSLAIWIPASGWIGDRIGTKKVFLFALAMFTLASALCGQAHSLGELVSFRVLQGVGGGMLTPVGTAMLFRAFPPLERAKASTVLIIPTVLAPALGPIIGGWLVTDVSWRWIFYVNLPVGVVGFVLGALYLREHKEGTAGPFDLPGFVLSGAGLALVLYALSEGPEKGWRSGPVLATAIVGVLLFALLILIETRVPHPMLALRLYRERMFRNANIVLTLTYGSFVGVLYILPLFLQELRGLTALQSGLTTFPQAVGVIISSQLVGRLYHRVGPRRLIFWGMLGMAGVTLLLALVGLHTDLWWIRLIMFGRGICMAFAFVPLQAATYANITPEDTGRASALYSTQRQVSAALGVGVLLTVLLSKGQPPALSGYHLAFLVGSCLVALAALTALLIRDEDAASTIAAPAPVAEAAV